MRLLCWSSVLSGPFRRLHLSKVVEGVQNEHGRRLRRLRPAARGRDNNRLPTRCMVANSRILSQWYEKELSPNGSFCLLGRCSAIPSFFRRTRRSASTLYFEL